MEDLQQVTGEERLPALRKGILGPEGLMAPTFKELVKQDPRMRSLLIVGAIFLIAPPIFSWFKNPDGWIRAYLGLLLYGFGLPLLVIAGLFFSRWRKLTRLAARGLEVAAIIEKAWSTRDGKMATVRFTLDGREHRVKVQVPSQHWNCDDGASDGVTSRGRR